MSGHTPGPWTQGRTLETAQTRRWTPGQIAANNIIESCMVLANFSIADQGRGRFMVASCGREDDARLIAAAPDLLEAVKRLIGGLSCMVPDPDNEADIQFGKAAIAKATQP